MRLKSTGRSISAALYLERSQHARPGLSLPSLRHAKSQARNAKKATPGEIASCAHFVTSCGHYWPRRLHVSHVAWPIAKTSVRSMSGAPPALNFQRFAFVDRCIDPLRAGRGRRGCGRVVSRSTRFRSVRGLALQYAVNFPLFERSISVSVDLMQIHGSVSAKRRGVSRAVFPRCSPDAFRSGRKFGKRATPSLRLACLRPFRSNVESRRNNVLPSRLGHMRRWLHRQSVLLPVKLDPVTFSAFAQGNGASLIRMVSVDVPRLPLEMKLLDGEFR